MQHKHLVAVMALALSVQMGASMPILAASSFRDVQGHWAQSHIEALAQRNILTGYENGTFRPNGYVTRAEFATMLTKALGSHRQITNDYHTAYKDVQPGNWAYPAIETLRQRELMEGYEGNWFKPNKQISRLEAMVVFVNALQLDLPSDSQAQNTLSKYSDAASVPSWARRQVAAAIERGFVVNYEDTTHIRAQRPITRAELASMTSMALLPEDSRMSTDTLGRANEGVMTSNELRVTSGELPKTTRDRFPMARNSQNDMVRDFVIPANTQLVGSLTKAPVYEVNRQDGTVSFMLEQALVNAGNEVVIPYGSTLKGRLVTSRSMDLTNDQARVAVDFYEIVFPDGYRINLEEKGFSDDVISTRAKNPNGQIIGNVRSKSSMSMDGIGSALETAFHSLPRDRAAVRDAESRDEIRSLTASTYEGNRVVLNKGDRFELRLTRPLPIEASTYWYGHGH